MKTFKVYLKVLAFLLIKCEMKFKNDRDLCSRAKV